MEAEPVRDYGRPDYPTRQEAAGLPDWMRGPTLVAPIFEHGEGRGAMGCVVTSPPVFLSEEEALEVLNEELGKHGVRLARSGITLDAIQVQPMIRRWLRGDGGKLTMVDEPQGRALPLHVTFADASKGIAALFVGEDSYGDLGGARSASTVQLYETLAVGRRLADQLAAFEGGGHFAVFYDPLTGRSPLFDDESELSMPILEVRRLIFRKLKEFDDASTKDGRMSMEAFSRLAREDEQYVAAMRTCEDFERVASIRDLRSQAADFARWLEERKVV